VDAQWRKVTHVNWRDPRGDNPVRQRLAAGESVVGSFVRLGCAESVEVCAHAGFDFVVVDTEHSPLGDDVVANLVRAADAAGIPALVRSVDTQPERLGRLLECAPVGVHLPQIRDVDHAAQAISATKYAPEGTRGLATGRGSGFGLRMNLEQYVETANQEGMVVLQVETADALDEIDRIARLPGCDVIFLGLTDLTVDLGIAGDYTHPSIERALAKARSAAEDAGVALGAPAASLDMARSLRQQGVRYVTSNDIRLLSDAAVAFTEGMARDG
jgi:4-hydroxy-2-oxoheptanedioate aldolase